MATKAEIDSVVSRPWSIDFDYGESPDEGVLAYVVEWPDCFAAGRTRAEAVKQLEDSMRTLVAHHLDGSGMIPDPIEAFSGKLALRLPRRLHRDAAVRATDDGVSLNTWLMTAIAREIGTPTDLLAATSGSRRSAADVARSYRKTAGAARKAVTGRGKANSRTGARSR